MFIYMVIYATWVSSTGMADFDLLQIFPIPLKEPVQKAGITMMYLFKNFILQHVDNLFCFIFIKDVLV